MHYISLIAAFAFLPLSAIADERIYEVNKYGQTQYGKDSYVKKDDRIYQVNLNSTHKCNAHPCIHFVRRLPAQAFARA